MQYAVFNFVNINIREMLIVDDWWKENFIFLPKEFRRLTHISSMFLPVECSNCLIENNRLPKCE